MRRVRRCGAWLLCTFLVLQTAAYGEYLGSDPFENIGPPDKVGGLASKYGLDRYGLDYHVDFGIDNPGGIIPEIQHAFAQQIWDLLSNLIKLMIDCFAWAFTTDLLNGPNGALTAVAASTQNLNENLQAQGWLYFGVVCLAGWGMYKAIAQRQLGAAVGGFAVSLLCAVLAMTIIDKPRDTIGAASNFANDVSESFLSGFGIAGSGQDTQTAITDHLFKTLIYDPWVVLDFGGLRHCVDTDVRDENGYPEPVKPTDRRRDICRDHIEPNAQGYGGYAERFLRYRVGTDARDNEYEALRKGEAPEFEPPNAPSNCPRAACTPEQVAENRQARQGYDDQFANYKVDKADSPAVDIQQAGGARSRVRAVAIMTIGALGIILLFGRLSVTVLIAQIIALGLLGIAPVALILGLFPMGHKFFKWWLTRLFTALFIKVVYAVVIAVLVALSAALMYASESAGFLVSFGLQCVLFWVIYLKRNLIINELSEAIGGQGHSTRTAALTAAAVYSMSRPYRAMTRGRFRGAATGAGAGAGAAAARRRDNDDVTDNDQVMDGGGDHGVEPDDPGTPDATPDSNGAGTGAGTGSSGNGSGSRRRGKRRYRVTKDPEELAALGGSDDKPVTWALLGSDQPEHSPEGGSRPEPEREEFAPDPEPSQDSEPSPRELRDEASERRKRKSRRPPRERPPGPPDAPRSGFFQEYTDAQDSGQGGQLFDDTDGQVNDEE